MDDITEPQADTTLSAVEVLTFNLTLKTDSGNYVAVNQLDSVSIFLNGEPWRTVPSQPRDIRLVERKIEDGLHVTTEEFQYLVAVNAGETGEYILAGDYADLLNDNQRLYPGSYSMEIRNIYFQDVDTTLVEIQANFFTSFEVVEGARSEYTGAYEIEL